MTLFWRLLRETAFVSAVLLTLAPSVSAQTFNVTTGTASWNVNGNWTPSGFPNAIDASATFQSPTGAQTVNLSTGITVGTINLTNDSASIFTLANGAGGSLTFQTSSGNANIFFNGTSTATNSMVVSASVTLNSSLVATVNNTAATGSASSTFTGALTGSGGFTKDGPGRFTFSTAAKAYTGPTIINQGRLRYTTTGTSTGTSSITVNSGGSLYLDQSAGAWSFGPSGSANITLNGSGTTEPTVGLGALKHNGGGAATLANNVGLASDSTIDVFSGSLQINGTFSGSSTLTKTGNGSLILANTSSSHSGNVIINQGTVNYSANVPSGGGVVTLSQFAGINNVVYRINSSQTVTDLSTVWTDTSGSRTQTIDLGTSGSTVLTINQLNDTTIGAGAVPTLAGIIVGSGSIVKNGPATLTLTSANTYLGPTTINNGFIAIDTETRFGTNPGTFNASQITLNGGGIRAINTSVDFGSNRGITLGSSGGTFDTNGQSISFSIPVAGTGSLTKVGSGLLTMPMASVYTGNTFIQDGTLLAYGGNDRLPTTTVVTLGSGSSSGVLQLGNPSIGGAINQTIAGLTHSGTGTGNAVLGNDAAISVLTVNNSANYQFGGTLGGAGTNNNNLALVKSGSGTLTLFGNNTYVGTTTVNGGTLNVDGSHSSSDTYTVNSGTLGGNGTINSDIDIFAATLAPGNSVGRLTVNGNVTFSSTSTFRVEINGTNAGVDYDQLSVGAGGALSLNNAALTATLGYFPQNTDMIFLTDNMSGAIGGIFNGLPDGSIITIGSFNATISYFGNFQNGTISGGDDVVIYNFAVPEPGTIALLGLTGFFGLQWYLRRKPQNTEAKAEVTGDPKPEANEPAPAETLTA